VLQAADPAAAFAAAENRFAQGGVPPVASIDPKVLARIKANEKLMYSLGIRGTPAVFYRTGNGKVHLIAGLPREDQLEQVFGAAPKKAD
jgi:thiol:disulfide interchange protein DsbG